MNDRFSSFHPIFLFAYFVILIGCICTQMHPVLLVTACLTGILYETQLRRFRWSVYLKLYIPVLLLITAWNMAFVHRGITALFVLWNGKRITLEAFIYGLDTGLLLVAMMIWVQILSLVFTEEKWMEVLGRISPTLALLLSMVFRFIPLYQERLKKIRQVRSANAVSASSFRHRIKCAVSDWSVLTSWALEHAVDTADSSKAREYGKRKRSRYSIFRVTGRDIAMFVLAGGLALALIWLALKGAFKISFYPRIRIHSGTELWIGTAVFCVYSGLPFFWDVSRRILWQYYRLKI